MLSKKQSSRPFSITLFEMELLIALIVTKKQLHFVCVSKWNSSAIEILPSHDLPKNLLLPFVIPLDHDHDGIAGFEV